MSSSVTPPERAPESLPLEGLGGGEPADDGGLPRLRRARRGPSTGRGVVAIVSGTVALALVAVVWAMPVPYVVERPGPVYNTLGSAGGKDVISIQGHETYPAHGALDLTTVYVEGGPNSDVSLLGLVRAAFDPTESITPVDTLYPKGVTRQQVAQENTVEMQSSQDNAVAAALKELAIPFTQRIKVAGLVTNSASAGKLEPHDTIVTVAGQTVDSLSTIQKLVAASQGKPLDVGFERDGTQHTVSITPRDAGQGKYLLGFTVTYAFTFPFTVDFALDKVGGPSAGMMFALGIIDKLTPGDLTGGKQIAGTGTIDPTGSVGEIGGIVQKMNGARREGATLFLAPAGNCGEVVGRIPDGLAVVRVDTLDGARRAVDSYAHGADPASLPQCTKG
ncbi:S16 family serine protease [Sinomonas sp. ASV322]|uniref:YlbL family protein n=1 Tax=Sinomonas sp. ASV322 TaxID=3041920 RepID=UPI0027DDE5D5|nr:S16 family serine protease [Sinomonas sp. ASV322]MDQ4503296.1 site-2 protease family protein [Sinomonas sp. ASV322]